MDNQRFKLDLENGFLTDDKNQLYSIGFNERVDFNELCAFLNTLDKENQTLLHIIDWCLTNYKEIDNLVFNSRDEFFIWLKNKEVI